MFCRDSRNERIAMMCLCHNLSEFAQCLTSRRFRCTCTCFTSRVGLLLLHMREGAESIISIYRNRPFVTVWQRKVTKGRFLYMEMIDSCTTLHPSSAPSPSTFHLISATLLNSTAGIHSPCQEPIDYLFCFCHSF